jgi:glycyl-tRNA synthetase beta chain
MESTVVDTSLTASSLREKDFGDFILEIGAEELPAGQIEAISSHIKSELAKLLADNKLAFEAINTMSSPRRLFFEIQSMQLLSPDRSLEIKGPPEKAGFIDGKFTQASLGFAAKNNLSAQDLLLKDGYVYGKQFIKGIEAERLLASALPDILSNVPGERFMRWAAHDIKFARPIEWISSLIIKANDEACPVDFELAGLVASHSSYGHRFLDNGSFEIKSKVQYLDELRKRGVYIDKAERRKRIINESQRLAESINGEIIFEEKLLDEIANITENPSPVLCGFDEKFLEIPELVLTTVMIVHQRYLPIKDKATGRLMSKFIAVSNNPLKGAVENIRKGNEKVIIPRFKDAEFFVREDLQLSLEARLEKLAKVNFQAGNMLDKAKRLQKIAGYMAGELASTFNEANPANTAKETIDKEHQKQILEAALLAKADLTTQLVFEFTELQGEIGGIYAARQGKSPRVSTAISEHYRPRFAGDQIPSTIGGKILAIADKLDTLVCAFAAGKIPKGSADPFALRRQANGLLEILLHSHLIIDVAKLVDQIVDFCAAEFGQGRTFIKTRGQGDKAKTVEVPEFDWEAARTGVKEFLEQRLEFVFELCHPQADINKAILASGKVLEELNTRHMMLHPLMDFKSHKDWAGFIEAAKRINNIIKNSQVSSSPEANKFVSDYESNLHETVKNFETKINQEARYSPLIKPEDLLLLIKPINEFFDKVLVNDPDEDIKTNRLALVSYANSVLKRVADFSLL